MSGEEEKHRFAVRSVFASGWPPDRPTPVDEERITMWLASSAGEAIERAEAEALQYASAERTRSKE